MIHTDEWHPDVIIFTDSLTLRVLWQALFPHKDHHVLFEVDYAVVAVFFFALALALVRSKSLIIFSR